ncbi:unnamed protein product [Clavelina lepadiformis]|uniref:Oxidation resistance protein 1 n=1 Tax=Clavelina lepadiformis TaxID=159417 RepID=A0ABP0G332_CLALP
MLSSKNMKNESATPSSITPQELVQYHVKPEDTLRSIAVVYNTTTSNLMKLNKLSSTYIFPDQVLEVPGLATLEQQLPASCHPSLSSNFAGDYSFLAPLSVTSSAPVTPRKSVDMSVDDSMILSQTTPSCQNLLTSQGDTTKGESNDMKAEEILNNPNKSKGCEEKFLKMDVQYITPAKVLVRGVLLITPTSIMFDPDPKDALCTSLGCEEFGIMYSLSSVTSISLFTNRKDCFSDSCGEVSSDQVLHDVKEEGDLQVETDHKERNNVKCSYVEVFDGKRCSGTDHSSESIAETSEDEKLKFEFPLLHSIVKTVEEMLPGGDDDTVAVYGDSTLQIDFIYLRVCSNMPMMKTYAISKDVDKEKITHVDSESESISNESWFQLHRRRSEQLLAFFTHWDPDPYAVDFAEQNGFIVFDVLHQGKQSGHPDKVCSRDGSPIEAEHKSRSRSSTDTSLEFMEGFLSSSFEKEWEIVSMEEARRRSTICAVDITNEILLPELNSNSHLLKAEMILELSKHLPARTEGCSWRLLYSTYEHGISLRTLYRNLNKRNEDGPVIMVIQDNENYLFGVFCSVRPHISDHFYGNGETFLFTLNPAVRFFDWSGENSFYMKGDVDALTFGGGEGSSGLWLDGDLCHGSSHSCLTFNNVVLSSSEDFFIQGVEVWDISNS